MIHCLHWDSERQDLGHEAACPPTLDQQQKTATLRTENPNRYELMPEIYPVVEGDEDCALAKNFTGRKLSEYYEKINEVAEQAGLKALNDFEYFEEWMLEDFGIEMPEKQLEWHSTREGIDALSALISLDGFPDDGELREEFQAIVGILTRAPSSSKGWRLQQDI